MRSLLFIAFLGCFYFLLASHYASYNVALLVLAVLGTAASLYVGRCILDYLRSLLFKAIRLKEGLTKLETKFRDKFFAPEPPNEKP